MLISHKIPHNLYASFTDSADMQCHTAIYPVNKWTCLLICEGRWEAFRLGGIKLIL